MPVRKVRVAKSSPNRKLAGRRVEVYMETPVGSSTEYVEPKYRLAWSPHFIREAWQAPPRSYEPIEPMFVASKEVWAARVAPLLKAAQPSLYRKIVRRLGFKYVVETE